ncbi:hypothetical protein JCM5353_008175 [Sporobolomyces roseus]
MDEDLPFTEPIASTSRAVFTLPYKPQVDQDTLNEPVAAPERLKSYEEAWTICHSRIQSTLSSLHDASLDQIVDFVKTEPSTTDPLALYTALSGNVPLKTGLILGASPGSSSLIFSSLIRQLVQPTTANDTRKRKPTIVSRLTSRECSNIKNALRSLIAGFVGSDADLELDDDEEEDEAVFAQQRSSALKSTLMVPEDLHNLVAWYEHRFGKKGKDQAPTLVILLEDLEAIDGKVLNQLISTLSHFTTTLPLVLLLGIATTSSALYNLIPQHTTNRLDISTFFVDPGIGAFNALVRGIFVDFQPPISLGPKAYSDLYRSFEDLHHSIDSTITYIQYLYMNHFLASPLALLALPESPSFSLNDTDLSDLLKTVPSLSTSPATRDTLIQARKKLEESAKDRPEAFEALMIILEFWEKKRTVENCLNLLLGTILNEDGERERDNDAGNGMKKLIDEVCGLVLQASSTKLPAFLRSLTSRLSAYSTSQHSSSTSLLDFLQSHLATLTQILAKPRPSGRSNLINVHLAGSAVNLPGFGDLGRSSGVTEVDKEFSKVAKEVSEGLRERLKLALRPCSEIEGHEIFYSDDTSASKRLNPAPLPTILKALTRLDPLDSNSSFPANEDGDETALFPLDIAIAYRIYRDLNSQGRLINLGDWWSGFELSAGDEPEITEAATQGKKTNGNGQKKRGKKRARDEDEDDESSDEDEDGDGPLRRKQARFLRSVADLAHLGFVHPTTRKPEHLLKSVY